MKTLKIFASLFLVVTLFASCEEEDEGTPQQITKNYTYSQNIRGSEGVKGELPLAALSLADVIGIEPARNLESADMQLADTYLEISGLNQFDSLDTAAVVLEDFTIKVGSRQGVNIGDFTTDPKTPNEWEPDEPQSTDEIINLIRNIFIDMTTGNKSAEITVSFTPNVNITSTDNVQLNISIRGTYNYLVFE